MNTRHAWVLVAVLPVVAAACGEGSDVPGTAPITTSPVTTSPVTTSPVGSDAEALAGTSWEARTLSDGDVVSPAVAGHVPTIEFGGDARTVSGSTGCNRYTGDVLIGASTISVTNVAVTERACLDPGAMEQEALFLGILMGADAVALADGNLELRSPAGTVTFVEPEPVVDAPLDGTLWTVDGLIAGDAVTSVLTTTTPTLRIDLTAGTLRGTTGCNDFFGEVQVLGEEITISELANTEIACEPQVMDQEAFILDVLREVQIFDVDGERLSLFTAGGRGLLYRAG